MVTAGLLLGRTGGGAVVAAAVGGLRSLVEHGRTGFLVEDRDPVEFAARIDLLLASPELAAQMGADAARRAETFSWSTTAGRLRRLYDDLKVRTLLECR